MKTRILYNDIHVYDVCRDPDLALEEGSIVKLGPTYFVRPGDTLSSIAGLYSSILCVRMMVGFSVVGRYSKHVFMCVCACMHVKTRFMCLCVCVHVCM